MENTLFIQTEVEQFKRDKLAERLQRCTEEQRAFFARIFPGTVPKSKLIAAIDLCDRTLRKNAQQAEGAGAGGAK